MLSGICLFLFSFTGAWGQQKGSIQGKVMDAIGKTALPAATIAVIRIKDSITLEQTISNREGVFRIPDLPQQDSLLLRIMHTSYNPYHRVIVLQESLLDLGNIYLGIAAKQLDTLRVMGQRPPVTVKQDTVEFHAGAFKTSPNAVIEDLLKKLPGLDIDENGNMTFNGKKISRVLVDGREFFGSDPKIAIRNLPPDIVDKIQVMDTKTLQQLYGGIGGSSDEKTLNIKLKKEKKVFGSITAGVGSDERYEASAMLNQFEGPKKLSVLGGTNNINKIGFSLNTGADQSMQSLTFVNEGNGITTSKIAGINFNNEHDKLKYNGSYNYTDALTDRSFTRERRQHIVPDSSFFTTNNNRAEDRSINHRVDLNMELTADTTSTLYIAPNFSFNKTSLSNFNTVLTTTHQGKPVNGGESLMQTEGESANASGYIFWGKRLKKAGRYFSLVVSPSYNRQETEEVNQVTNQFYQDQNGNDSLSFLNQFIHSRSNSTRYDMSISYTEPISKSFRLNINEGVQWNSSDADRGVYNRDSSGNQQTLDSALSAAYTTRTFNNTTSLSLGYMKEKWDASVGLSTTYTHISNEIHTQEIVLHQYQFNYAPSFNVHYRIARNKNFRLIFFAHTTQPTLEQLQPVPDNRNPLLIRLGTPQLKPTFTPNYLLDYSSSNILSNIFLMAYLQYASEQNAIVNAIWYDELGRQVSQFMNVDGNYNSSAAVHFRKSWRSTQEQKGIGVRLNASQRRSSTFVNGLLIKVLTWRWAPALTLQYSHTTLLEVNVSYTPSFNIVKYGAPSLGDQDYRLHTIRADVRLSWPKSFQLESNAVYNYNSQAPPGFKKDAFLWNLNLTQQLFRNKQGLLKFTVYDLLKQNNNIRRTTADNYIEDVQAAVLQQYFMLSFIYKLSLKVKI